MGKKIKYNYDEVTGRSEAIIWNKGKRYKGTAVTNELDKDVMSSYTGLTIALARAEIKRSNSKAAECQNKMNALKAQMVRLSEEKRIHLQKSLNMAKELEEYIDEKAEFANKLRDVRTKKEGIRQSEEGK